jgi:hypothetical protein
VFVYRQTPQPPQTRHPRRPLKRYEQQRFLVKIQITRSGNKEVNVGMVSDSCIFSTGYSSLLHKPLPISGVITSSRFVSSRVTVPLLAARKLLSIEYKIDITPAEAPVGRTYSDDHRHSTFFVRVYNCVKRHLLSPVGLSQRSGSSVTSVTKRRCTCFLCFLCFHVTSFPCV